MDILSQRLRANERASENSRERERERKRNQRYLAVSSISARKSISLESVIKIRSKIKRLTFETG